MNDQMELTAEFVQIGKKYGFTIKPCGESQKLAATGADCSGCMTTKTYEDAIGSHLVAAIHQGHRGLDDSLPGVLLNDFS